jgi:hypothetical protein
MTLDYHAIPGMNSYSPSSFTSLQFYKIATSADVERLFSQGHLLLLHICNRLSAKSTRAILCLGSWSLLGFIKDNNIIAAVKLTEANEGV